jgi:hypothetical protein
VSRVLGSEEYLGSGRLWTFGGIPVRGPSTPGMRRVWPARSVREEMTSAVGSTLLAAIP